MPRCWTFFENFQLPMLRFLCAFVFAIATIGISHAVQSLSGPEVFEKANHKVFLLVVTSDEPGVFDVLAQGSAVLIAPGRFVTACALLERGKHFVVSRREDKIVERVLVVEYRKDRALCELDLAEPSPGFDKPAELAPPDSLHIGDTVFAVNAPRGMELVISDGLVSGLQYVTGTMQLIQTTAAFASGSIGGGLFDDRGRLAGITTGIAKDKQKAHLAVGAQSIPSAGISAANLLKQRSGKMANVSTPEQGPDPFPRKQQDLVVADKQPAKDAPLADKPATHGPAAEARIVAARKPIALRLAPYRSMGDNGIAAKLYEQMAKKGQLAGLDDDAAIRKVYEALIREHVNEQLKWNEGGNYVAEFQIQLRRSGEVMFVIPARASGLERYDQEARRAIGAASPLPVPQDNDVFEQMSEVTLVVQAPDRKASQPAPPATPAKPAAPRKKAK
jgi:hypothetical protein